MIAKAGSESKLGEQCDVSAELACELCGGLIDVFLAANVRPLSTPCCTGACLCLPLVPALDQS